MPRLHCYKVDIISQLTSLQLECNQGAFPLSIFRWEALK